MSIRFGLGLIATVCVLLSTCLSSSRLLGADPYVVVLGVAQDAGYPQTGCRKECCASAWSDPTKRRHTVSLAAVDPDSDERWLFDCSPDFRDQLRMLDKIAPPKATPGLSGILLTHAHMGHYSGLIHLGREAIGAKRLPVFAMPRMKKFLSSSGPWSQLVSLENIVLRDLSDGKSIKLNERISVTPFLVPHRDEFSETVGFRVQGPNHAVVYLPDIDKWERWETPIENIIRKCSVAYLDGTFYSNGELPGRDMSKIPHPFIVESIQRFVRLPAAERSKVRFIHFNHTNPAIDANSSAVERIRDAGHHAAQQGERVGL
jgi:pyrroloquinoline quinone biosynthesis protein B